MSGSNGSRQHNNGSVKGLEWVRLDTAWPRNPKVLELLHIKAHKALVVYVASLAYCGEHGLDGYVPPYALASCHGTTKDAAQLVEVRLWQEIPDHPGWQINDWKDYQPEAEEMRKRTEKARKAARKRWGSR